MTYEDALLAEVSQAEALAEINRHGCSAEDFLNECGDHPYYCGEDVLAWLGY